MASDPMPQLLRKPLFLLTHYVYQGLLIVIQAVSGQAGEAMRVQRAESGGDMGRRDVGE